MNIRAEEASSIRIFLESHDAKFKGASVLDIGCGKQPYRKIIEDSGGTYVGMDDSRHPGAVVEEHIGPTWAQLPRTPFDVVMMTQVWQYIDLDELRRLLHDLATGWPLKKNGWLLVTGPTNWPIVEKEDLHRFTISGVEQLLKSVGFKDVYAYYRHSIRHDGETWPCGWAVAAQS